MPITQPPDIEELLQAVTLQTTNPMGLFTPSGKLNAMAIDSHVAAGDKGLGGRGRTPTPASYQPGFAFEGKQPVCRCH